MSVLIIGSEGSMGRRYKAILNYLGKTYQCADRDKSPETIKKILSFNEGVIIASPTETHASMIELVMDSKKPILCEKPVVKDTAKLDELLTKLEKARTPFRMMLQYQVLLHKNRIGRSFYNYFKTGNDGLAWDCLQVIGLARGPVVLDNVSPLWTCMINGQALKFDHMDAAYIAYVQQWFNYPQQDFGLIRDVHQKTAKYAESTKALCGAV